MFEYWELKKTSPMVVRTAHIIFILHRTLKLNCFKSMSKFFMWSHPVVTISLQFTKASYFKYTIWWGSFDINFPNDINFQNNQITSLIPFWIKVKTAYPLLLSELTSRKIMGFTIWYICEQSFFKFSHLEK